MRVIYLTKFILPLLLITAKCFSQAGITATPPKLFYRAPAGTSAIQKVYISNPIKNDLEIGVSLGDWKYDTTGVNSLQDPGTLKTSCADWIRILPGSYFTLLPEEKKEISVELNVPQDADQSIPVHTAMVYFTQLNPADGKSSTGAAIRISVRMGIKIYHSFTNTDEKALEVVDLTDAPSKVPGSPGFLEIKLQNTGKIWIDGTIKWELLNSQNGEKVKLDDQLFYSLPGDKTTLFKQLPEKLKKGNYTATAIVNFGNKDELKIVEVEFEY
ncbi:MAG: hypothetical protein EOO92_07280 [Pedobacter sp.]|nr:MAG: hypothetical protein EOO92_07280 [Pedobacter sp.]